MEKIETGMYVRTTNGISKVDDINDVREITWYGSEKPLKNVYLINKGYIIKASYNIIDLIELGDYVNGHRVYRMHRHATNGYLILELELGYDDGFGGEYDDSILEEEIKSIVTHEQFDNMKYEVK